MNLRMGAARGAALAAAVTLTVGLAACASEESDATAAPFKAPTMAPEQSLSEACNISSHAVDQLVADTEAEIQAGLAAAGQELLSGSMPSFDFLTLTFSGALSSVESQVTNSEVAAAIGRIGDGLNGFGSIERPESILGVPGYLTAIGDQVATLSAAGQDLRTLCGG